MLLAIDTVNHLLIVTTPPVNGAIFIDFQSDVFSEAMVQFGIVPNTYLRKRNFPVVSLGGESTPIGPLPDLYFIQDPWQMHIPVANRPATIMMAGDVFHENPDKPLFDDMANLGFQYYTSTRIYRDDRLQKIYAAHYHKRKRDEVTKLETIYEEDGATVLAEFDTVDNGTEILEVIPRV